MLAVGLAKADAGDTLNVFVGATATYDDNVFRLPESANPRLALGKPTKSDQLEVTYAGIRLDKSYSQQRVQVDATVSNYRYQTFNQLNFDALDYRVLWMWHLTQRFSGHLSADSKQTQSNIAETRNYTSSSTVTTQNRRFDADWWLHGNWHLTGGVAQYSWRNSKTFRAEDSVLRRSADAGVRYVEASGSSLELLTRQARGTYDERQLNVPQLLDTGFTQTETELRMSWILSGKSTLSGRVTRLQRKHQHFVQRDFGGTAGRLDYTLMPAGKLQLKLSAARDIASYQTANHSYYVNESFAFTPVWQISDKVALRLNLESSQRDFLGGAALALPVARRDHGRSVQLSLDWSPLRFLQLTFSLQHDERSSNDANLGFEANAASVTAQISF